MADQPSESIPAPETSSEDAPLLDTSASHEEPAPEPRPQLKKPVLICTWLSLSLSIMVWPFLIALKVLWSNEPNDYHDGWAIKDDTAALLGLSIATAVFALANLLRLHYWRKPLPLLINLIANCILAFYLLAVSATGISNGLDSTCYRSWYPNPNPDPTPIEPPPIEQGCWEFAHKVLVVQEVGMSLGVVLGITTLVLAVLNCILAYRSKFWHGLAMRLPTGTFTVELTVKILRQEEQQGGRPARQ